MTSSTAVRIQIEEHLARLQAELHGRALELIRSLLPGKAAHGKRLLELAGRIPLANCEEMTRAIEEGCEKIDPP